MSLLLRKFNQIKKEQNKVNSLVLTDWINEFREKQGIKTKFLHKNLLAKIDKYNQEVNELNLKPVEIGNYEDAKGEKRKCYLLTKHEALIFASAENNIIKAWVIQHMDNLEIEYEIAIASKEQTKLTHEGLYDLIKEHKLDKVNSEYAKINNFINMTTDLKFGFKQGTLKKETMNTEQLEFRALVEIKWLEYYQGKKSGIKARIEREVL